MSYYAVPECNIRNEIKRELDSPNYFTKKDLDRATGFDTSDLGSKKHFSFES